MVIPKREGKCCDAIVRHIEREAGSTRTNVCDPEIKGEDGRVDLYVKVDGQAYALEHTRLFPFGNRVDLAKPFQTLKSRVEHWFPDPLPGAAYYELYIPLDFHPPSRGKKGERQLDSLRDWIRAKVDVLHTRAPGRPRPPAHVYTLDKINGRPDGWKCEFTLARSSDGVAYPRVAGTLSVFIGSPDDPEASFIDDLCRAFDRKCEKLARCKEECIGIHTILILEGNDLPFGYDLYVSKHLPSLLEECSAPPDGIFLVIPRDPFWQVWVIKRGGSHWPDGRIPMPHKGYHDFPSPVAHGHPRKIAEALGISDTRRETLAELRPYFPIEDDLEDIKPT